MSKLSELQTQLKETTLFTRDVTITEPVDGVLSVAVSHLKDFPIFVTVDEDMMNCWAVLAKEDEFTTEQKVELHTKLLEANGIAELSNFALIDGEYCLKGDLSSTSTFDNIVLELESLIDAIEDGIEDIFLPILR